MDEKRREKYLMARYRRELERYLNRIVSFAMGGDFKKSEYESMVQKALQKLQKVERVPLYNDYFEKLEAFIEMTKGLVGGEREADEIKSEILHEANRIRKSKRKKSYSRKSRGSGTDEGY
ncbi:hypothetical protein NNO_1993 [Hydrogenimonas sp.]|nr:hypothetical protein NNO_1993 [Hydrogenimonas sp.]